MNDIERPMGDLDLIMPTRYWFKFYHDCWPLGGRHGWQLVTMGPGDDKRRFDPPYLAHMMYGLEVNIFFCWRTRDYGNIDYNKVWRESEIIDGVRCQSLKDCLEWKLDVRRAKDQADILRILERYPELIANENSPTEA